jgi:hypothetical protein
MALYARGQAMNAGGLPHAARPMWDSVPVPARRGHTLPPSGWRPPRLTRRHPRRMHAIGEGGDSLAAARRASAVIEYRRGRGDQRATSTHIEACSETRVTHRLPATPRLSTGPRL